MSDSEDSQSQPFVAYVVLGWNNKDLLKGCFESIISQDYPYKKIVYVDNASEDGTVDYVKKNYPSVEVLEQPKNYGFAKGNNIGIKYVLSDKRVQYVVLLNTDATLASTWTSTLVNFAKDQVKCATLQTVTLDYFDHNTIDSTHIYISRNGQGTQGSYRRVIDNESDVIPKKVFGCNAAAILITSKFINAQPFKKLFDERMFMYLEDVDVAARATMMGWHSFVVPGSRAYHMGSASSGKNPGFSLYMTFRNNSRLLFVNLPLAIVIRMIPSIIAGDRERIRHLKRIGEHDAAKKVLKGRINGIIILPSAIPRAIRMKLMRRVLTDDIWSLMRRGF